MTEGPISLGASRADRSGDCRDWSVADALREALRQVEDGEFDAEIVYVALAGNRVDGDRDYTYHAAGGTKLEIVGLLARHLHIVNEG